MLRVIDGLVSTFLLVAGVAGGALSSIDIAGAFSIVAGEFVATTKFQNEVLRGEIALERGDIFKPIAVMKMDKVSSLLALIGISNQQQGLKEELLTFHDNPDALMKLIRFCP
jgi:hypothetical protein